MNHSARRINALAEGLSARTYLEIGVDEGKTFNDVGIPVRTAVDVKFKFETGPFENEKTSFFADYSDEFFSRRHDGSSFDFIFIDGSHQFEQVVRDFSNAVVFSHASSIILLDDTKPNDVYSALPNLADTRRFRSEAGVVDGSWHGDVFKIVAYIHDFWPSLNYKTISGSGNVQTLVWRSSKFIRKPRFNSLEVISRMTYFDLMKNLDLLREDTEKHALELCLSELESPTIS